MPPPSVSANPEAPVEISIETFNPYVNEPFELSLEEGAREPLLLLSATALKHSMAGFRIPFTLTFRASSRQFYVPQGIYLLEHPQAGHFDLFLVPIGTDETGMLFQADFN